MKAPAGSGAPLPGTPAWALRYAAFGNAAGARIRGRTHSPL